MAPSSITLIARPTPPVAQPDGSGTGRSLPPSLLIIATVSSLSATLLSLIAIYSHLKRYLKPHLQRHVVRLLLIVPIYATSSLIGLFSLPAAFLIDLIRDLYEAFAIYSFFELLVAYLGGERSTLILMIGRQPVPHPWPFRIFFRDLDLSDPYTFLNIKRGVLQYVQIKPILAISTVILKSFGRYEEGQLAAGNGYTYISAIYNVSIFLSLYALALFWSALSHELAPFRPTSKFLTVKGVVFATFWQGWAISVLVAAGLVKTIGPISDASFLRLGLQDLLLTLEMPLFALGHMYAFSSKDYIDEWATYQARLPILYALRDALGARDVVQDFKKTIRGTGYGYATFEPARGAVHQGLARRRRLQAGLRYTQGGKAKYFLPGLQAQHGLPPDPSNDGQRTRGPIAAVKNWIEARKMAQEGYAPMTDEEASHIVSINPDSESEDETHGKSDTRRAREGKARKLALGLEANLFFFADHHGSDADDGGDGGQLPNTAPHANHAQEAKAYSLPFTSPSRNQSEENLYTKAKNLEHGDYAFPTIACGKSTADEIESGEQSRLLGSRHPVYSRANDSGSDSGSRGRVVSSQRDRKRRVEGWMDRVSSKLLGRGQGSGSDSDHNDQTDDDDEDERQQRKKKQKRGVWGALGSDDEDREEAEEESGGGASGSGSGSKDSNPTSSDSKQRSSKSKHQTSSSNSKHHSSKSKHQSSSDSKQRFSSDSKQQKAGPSTSSSSRSSSIDSSSHGAVDLIVSDPQAERRNRDMERRRGDPAVRTDRNSRRVFKRVWQGQEASTSQGTPRKHVPAAEEEATTPAAPTEEVITTPVPEPADDSEGKTAVNVEPPQQEREEDPKAKEDQNASESSSVLAAPLSSSSSEAASPTQEEQKRQPHHMPVYHRHDEWKWGGADDTIANEGDGSGSRNPWA